MIDFFFFFFFKKIFFFFFFFFFFSQFIHSIYFYSQKNYLHYISIFVLFIYLTISLFLFVICLEKQGGDSLEIDVDIHDPRETLVFTSMRQGEGHTSFIVFLEGRYRICFGNLFSTSLKHLAFLIKCREQNLNHGQSKTLKFNFLKYSQYFSIDFSKEFQFQICFPLFFHC